MTALDLVRDFYSEIWNRGDLDAVSRLCHEDMEFRGSLGDRADDHAGFIAYVRKIRDAFAGYECVIEDAVCTDDRVFARMTFRGTNVESLMGYPPTARLVTWAGAALFDVRDGRIAKLWVLGDIHDLRSQLEARWGGDGCSP